MTTIALAFLAGCLSVLSPCVLPLLPIVLGGALASHRLGPLMLAAGLALSFTLIGLFVALFGFTIGLVGDVFRTAGALAMLAVGVVLLTPRLQIGLATAGGPAANWIENRLGAQTADGRLGQFGVGLLLGAVWSPCVGPTLGAASVLAARGENLGSVALTMLAFGIGAGLPLALLGLLSREALLRWRTRLAGGAGALKAAFGILLAAVGIAILTGLDKTIETALLRASPNWLTDLTTRL